MPYATIGNVSIYYEIHGPHDAPPLVLIGGWASYRWIWFRQVPTLKAKFKCIVFDNRGAGRSSKPDIPYTMEMFAADTVGLLDTLNIEKAHVLGISMGGLIAQQEGTRPHEGHVAAQDIEELRQFIEARASQEGAKCERALLVGQ